MRSGPSRRVARCALRRRFSVWRSPGANSLRRVIALDLYATIISWALRVEACLRAVTRNMRMSPLCNVRISPFLVWFARGTGMGDEVLGMSARERERSHVVRLVIGKS